MTLHYPEDVCLPLPHPLTRMAVFMHHMESTNKTQPQTSSWHATDVNAAEYFIMCSCYRNSLY